MISWKKILLVVLTIGIMASISFADTRSCVTNADTFLVTDLDSARDLMRIYLKGSTDYEMGKAGMHLAEEGKLFFLDKGIDIEVGEAIIGSVDGKPMTLFKAVARGKTGFIPPDMFTCK